jgi:hypothetical protein
LKELGTGVGESIDLLEGLSAEELMGAKAGLEGDFRRSGVEVDINVDLALVKETLGVVRVSVWRCWRTILFVSELAVESVGNYQRLGIAQLICVMLARCGGSQHVLEIVEAVQNWWTFDSVASACCPGASRLGSHISLMSAMSVKDDLWYDVLSAVDHATRTVFYWACFPVACAAHPVGPCPGVESSMRETGEESEGSESIEVLDLES